MRGARRFVLYRRQGCALCDEAEAWMDSHHAGDWILATVTAADRPGWVWIWPGVRAPAQGITPSLRTADFFEDPAGTPAELQRKGFPAVWDRRSGLMLYGLAGVQRAGQSAQEMLAAGLVPFLPESEPGAVSGALSAPPGSSAGAPVLSGATKL